MSAIRRSTTTFSSLNSGMPYRRMPPARAALSYTTTRNPIRLSVSATASPAGPDPITATRFSRRTAGGRGFIRPRSKARSIIANSICRIATGSRLMPSTHEPSQGAGQMRPVNSGKLFVASSISSASLQRPW